MQLICEKMRCLRSIALVFGALFATTAWPQQTSPVDRAAVREFQARVTAAQGEVSITRDNRPYLIEIAIEGKR